MAYLYILCITLVSIGIIIMMIAIRTGLQVNRTVPEEFTRKWLAITFLMLFVLFGYCGFIVMQLTDSNTYLQIITSLIFFGGALFVLLIMNLSRLTIAQVDPEQK